MQNQTHLDPESVSLASLLAEQERIRNHRIAGVRTVLVVLSSAGMVFDRDALRQKILLTYPDATVFFRTTQGFSLGAAAPQSVDLLIDFTGPSQRQGWFYAKKLRRTARVAIGRNVGWFRKKIYDRIFDEKVASVSTQLPKEPLARERIVQKQVLELAGIPISQHGDVTPDRGQTIALELPPLNRL